MGFVYLGGVYREHRGFTTDGACDQAPLPCVNPKWALTMVMASASCFALEPNDDGTITVHQAFSYAYGKTGIYRDALNKES